MPLEFSDKEPNFIYDKNYYFDVDKNTIYGKRIYSISYFHELSHFRDYQNKIYKKIHFGISVFTQNIGTIFYAMLLLGLFVPNKQTMFTLTLILMGLCAIPYAVFSGQEEIRAGIYSVIKYLKYKRGL